MHVEIKYKIVSLIILVLKKIFGWRYIKTPTKEIWKCYSKECVL